MESKNRRTTLLGVLACFLLGVACLTASVYQARVIHPLVTVGHRVEAMVIDIEVGVKGGKRAVYQFTTGTGETLVRRDAFDMYLVRPRRGEVVTLLYDPAHPKRVTADLGIWTWQGPTIFGAGFVFLIALGVIFLRADRASRKG